MMIPSKDFEHLDQYYKGELTANVLLNKAVVWHVTKPINKLMLFYWKIVSALYYFNTRGDREGGRGFMVGIRTPASMTI